MEKLQFISDIMTEMLTALSHNELIQHTHRQQQSTIQNNVYCFWRY